MKSQRDLSLRPGAFPVRTRQLTSKADGKDFLLLVKARSRQPRSAAHHRCTALAVLLAALLTSPLLVTAARPAAAATPTHQLAFDRPSTSALRASPRKVYAHYVSWSPPSLDNRPAESDYYTRNFLAPDGEGGKYRASGGKQRDRPQPRPVRSGDWRLQDMEYEVRTAIAAGLDGFVVSMVQLGDSGGQWAANTARLLRAAQNVDPGFDIVLRPNMISFDDVSASALAKYLGTLGSHPSAARLADGRLVISPFLADRWSVDKWKQFLSTMQNTYGKRVALWPLFHDERKWASAFSPISYGLANWGERSPAGNDPVPTHRDSRRGRIAAVQARGDKWMQPVAMQDARPAQGTFEEAENSGALRATWAVAIKGGADAVHIPTWNDFAEGTAVTPTPKHGWSLLDVNAYYLAWYKTGRPPAIVRDRVYLTHRTQPVAADPRFPQTRLMSRRGSSPARDTVEALTFLKAPARVTVQVGSRAYVCQADAGVDTCTVPLGTGKVSVKVARAGSTVAATTSPHVITSSPYVQDLDYVAASSGRQPTSGTNGTAVTSTTKVVKTVVVPAKADGYANAGAPSNTYGQSSTLSSRGKVAATSYLRFDLPRQPSGSTLSKAVLRLHTGSASSAGSVNSHSVSRAGNGWSESTLNWRNRPATSGALGSLRSGTAANRSYDTTLSLTPSRALLGTEATIAISSGGTDELRLWSKDFGTYTKRPQLVLSFLPN